MKIKIPDELKADIPQTMWGRILSATPVVMTVVATALAGLASSEMTRAQYSRSLAAQQQSKAGDQWGFFQAKRLRGAMQRSTLDVLQGLGTVRSLTVEAVGSLPTEAQAALLKGELPALPAGEALDGTLKAALEAIDHGKPDVEIAALIAKVNDAKLADAVRVAKERAQAFDATIQPVTQAVEARERALMSSADAGTVGRDFTAARLRYVAARYDAEARLNQSVANLYELQVRRSNMSAERHHKRSQRFFYGMLGAQAAVIIATFAIAARKRNLLWSLAAAAGAAAIGFAVYVYLWV